MNKSLPASGSPPFPTTLQVSVTVLEGTKGQALSEFSLSLSFLLPLCGRFDVLVLCTLGASVLQCMTLRCYLAVSLTGLQETRGRGRAFTFVISIAWHIARQIYNENLTGREYPTKIVVR